MAEVQSIVATELLPSRRSRYLLCRRMEHATGTALHGATNAPMAKRKPPTEASIQERLRRGYGSGEGDRYKEWIGFRDFSSRGNVTRHKSPITGLRHTVFSGIEDDLFCMVQCQPKTATIQLQRAMEREITLACASSLGVEHPRYPETDIFTVMSLDAVVQRRRADGTTYVEVFDSKPSVDLGDRRVLEKLSIHRLYCHYKGWTHRIVTEKTFPNHIRKNLAWMRAGIRKKLEVENPTGLFTTYPDLVLADLKARRRHLPLNQYGAWIDAKHVLPTGIGLRILQILAWRNKIHVDLTAHEIQRSSTRDLIPR